MLAGVALLLLGLADLIARRADVADRRDRADATATELAAARFDDLLASTTRTLRVVGSDGEEAGKVKEVRATDILVDRPMARDIYVPLEAIQAIVDASASTRRNQALAQAKGLLSGLFDEAYRQRARLALLTASGNRPQWQRHRASRA